MKSNLIFVEIEIEIGGGLATTVSPALASLS